MRITAQATPLGDRVSVGRLGSITARKSRIRSCKEPTQVEGRLSSRAFSRDNSCDRSSDNSSGSKTLGSPRPGIAVADLGKSSSQADGFTQADARRNLETAQLSRDRTRLDAAIEDVRRLGVDGRLI